MKTTIDDLSPVKKKIMIEIEAEDVEKKVDKAYRDYGKSARIKGFRPGKIPRKIIENYFGKQVLQEVTDSLIKETLPRALETTKILPLNIPVIENEILKRGKNYKYSAIMEVRPEFELNEYKGIEVEKEVCSVTDKDVDKELEGIREANAKLNDIHEERGIQEGDYVIIDYEGFDDKGPINGIKGQNFTVIIGKRRFYPGVEEALIGTKKGDTPSVTVDFDNSYYHKGLAGKRVTFKIKIIDIKEIELPVLDDDFIGQLAGDIRGLDELKEKIKEGLISREQKRIDKELKERLLAKISDGVDFELPESLIEAEIDAGIDSVKQNLMRAGSDFEKSGLNEAKLREEFRPISEKKVKGILILGEIAKRNNLTVDEQNVMEGFKEMSKNTGHEAEALYKYYEANNIMESFRQTLLKEKTLNYLVENARVIEMDVDAIQNTSK